MALGRRLLAVLAIAMAFALSACGLNPQPEVPSDEGTGGASGGAETDAAVPIADTDAAWPGPQGAAGADPADKRKDESDNSAAPRPGYRAPMDAGSDGDAEGPPTVTM